MERITGNWLTKGDRNGIVSEIWPKFEDELNALGFNLSENIHFGVYRLTVRGDYDHYDRPTLEANFEYPEKSLKEEIQKEVISDHTNFLARSMKRIYQSDPPHSNVSSCVSLAYLDLFYQDKENSIKFRITPEFFYDKPRDFKYKQYPLESTRLVVETECRNNTLDDDIREIYSGLRSVLRHKKNFNETLNTLKHKKLRQFR